MTLNTNDIVQLTINAPSLGDKRRVFPAGYQFRVRRVVTELPDLAEIRAEQEHGDRAKPRTRRMTRIEPVVEVLTLTPDRSRLMFLAEHLEPVTIAATSVDD